MRIKTPSVTFGLSPLGPCGASREAYHLEEDQSLLAWVVAGAQQAFAALLDRHAPLAIRPRQPDLQEPDPGRGCRPGCIRLHLVHLVHLVHLAGGSAVRCDAGKRTAYVFSAVHNKAVDATRHEASLRRRDEVDSRTEVGGDDPVGEETWINIHRSKVRSALAQLSDVQREALELASFGGLSYCEVAGCLRVPVGTAKTRLRHGLREFARRPADPPRAGELTLRPAGGLPAVRRQVVLPGNGDA